jgi:hypothetical protein
LNKLKTEEFNKGHSFRIASAATYGLVCEAVSLVPGVAFTKRRRFFWSGEDVSAEFAFRGHAFKIETDSWDGAFWVMTNDGEKHEAEMQELRAAVERFEVSGTRMLFRVLAGIIAAFLLLIGLPVGLHAMFTDSGESCLWDVFGAIACLYAGLGLAEGARTGRWYNMRA